MTMTASAKPWLEPLHRIAALEYALIEACHADADGAWEVEQARLAARAGAAQVHLFDLGTALRDLGEDSISYARCMRLALTMSGSHREILERLTREYTRLLAQEGLPDGLRGILRANLAEQRGLDAIGATLTSTRLEEAAA